MLAIIIYNEIYERGDHSGILETSNKIVGGLYTDISYNMAAANIGKNNILYYIPLVISGKNYQEKKADLRNKAIEYQNTYYDFCNYSYGELSDIQTFFEKAGRRYGLLTEFTDNGII